MRNFLIADVVPGKGLLVKWVTDIDHLIGSVESLVSPWAVFGQMLRERGNIVISFPEAMSD